MARATSESDKNGLNVSRLKTIFDTFRAGKTTAKFVNKCQHTMTIFDTSRQFSFAWRQFSESSFLWGVNNTQRGTKTYGFPNGKFWRLSKVAILVHLHFWYTFGWLCGTQKGIKTDGFSKWQVQGTFKTSNCGAPAILVRAWVFPRGGALRKNCRTCLRTSGQQTRR